MLTFITRQLGFAFRLGSVVGGCPCRLKIFFISQFLRSMIFQGSQPHSSAVIWKKLIKVSDHFNIVVWNIILHIVILYGLNPDNFMRFVIFQESQLLSSIDHSPKEKGSDYRTQFLTATRTLCRNISLIQTIKINYVNWKSLDLKREQILTYQIFSKIT